MPSTIHEPRLVIDDNFWIEVGNPRGVECPPSGRIVAVEYNNGDSIRVEFFQIVDSEALSRRYRYTDLARSLLDTEAEGYLVTAVEVRMKVVSPSGQPIIDFGADAMRVGGNTFTGTVMTGGRIGLSIS
jgi:hypothetical protein